MINTMANHKQNSQQGTLDLLLYKAKYVEGIQNLQTTLSDINKNMETIKELYNGENKDKKKYEEIKKEYEDAEMLIIEVTNFGQNMFTNKNYINKFIERCLNLMDFIQKFTIYVQKKIQLYIDENGDKET